MASAFKYAHSSAAQWHDATQICLTLLGAIPANANLGFIYVTDIFASDMRNILTLVKEKTGIEHWVGSAGLGICCTNQEYLDQPAIAIMLGEFPEHTFQVFPTIKNLEEIPAQATVGSQPAYFAIVHGDPENQQTPKLIEQFAGKMESGFVVGGLTSSRNVNAQVADQVTHGGLSGVVFSSAVSLTTRLTQGVSPLGDLHEITECEDNVIIRIDGRPALDVFKEEIGEVLSRDMRHLANYIFAGLHITGSDTSDYLVRNLVGIDVDRKLLAIGDIVENGRQILFCRRDGASAVQDMARMLKEIKSGITGVPRGAIYFSCLGRGESMFGPDSEELKMISRELGDIPLVGFFANGEVSHNRLYGYTGVLTLFM